MTVGGRTPAPLVDDRLVTSRRGGASSVILGGLGELLITAGALLALFVVWQLWWTDVESGSVQSGLVASLETSFDSPDAAPASDSPAIATGFANLLVPRWGEGYVKPISEGVDRTAVLDTLGIGHYPGTAMPGQVGNFALAAHRVTSGKPFNAIADLQVGDALVVETAEGWYVYRVTETTIVLPSETSVIAPVPGQPGIEPTEAMITLTTCHPMFSTRQRFVVHGVLESTSPRSDGRPGILTDGAGIATGSEG